MKVLNYKRDAIYFMIEIKKRFRKPKIYTGKFCKGYENEKLPEVLEMYDENGEIGGIKMERVVKAHIIKLNFKEISNKQEVRQ